MMMPRESTQRPRNAFVDVFNSFLIQNAANHATSIRKIVRSEKKNGVRWKFNANLLLEKMALDGIWRYRRRR